MKKRYLSLLLAVLLLTTALTGCGASAPKSDAAMDYFAGSSTGSAMAPDYKFEMEESMDMVTDSMNGSAVVMPEAPMEEPKVPDSGKVDAAAGTAAQMSEKIIYSANVEMETLEFDKTVNSLESTVASIGGFIEGSNVSVLNKHPEYAPLFEPDGWSWCLSNPAARRYIEDIVTELCDIFDEPEFFHIGCDEAYDADGNVQILNRRAWYTVRVPAEKFSQFLTFAGELGNVISTNRNAQNVTSQYTDFEARLESLQVQEERLLEMMKKSDDINGLITLESRLSDVRYQIESIQRNLKNLDGKLAYSTVDFTIREVRVYQPTVKVQRTFWQRLGDSFGRGWDNFVDGWADFAVGLVGSIFPLTVFVIIVVAAVLILRKVVKKSRQKSAERLAKLYPKKEEEKSE